MNIRKVLVRTAGLVNTQLEKTHWCLFFTLTYRDGAKWEPEQITKFLQHYREYIKRRVIKGDRPYKNEKLVYMWTTEKNKDRDYLHYHGLIWIPKGIKPSRLPMPDKQGWWKHGDTNVQESYSPAGYIAKYISKSDHTFPEGCRRYAIQVASIIRIDYLRIPNWLCYFSQFGDRIFRLKGAGWYNQRTGQSFESPYYYDSIHHLHCKPYINQFEPAYVSQCLLAQTGVPF